MDQELIHYLDAKFAGVDGNIAELRSDTNAKFAGVDGKFAELRSEMNARFAGVDQKLIELRQEFREDIEKMETKLLIAFHQWSSPMETRVRTMTTVGLGNEERLGMLEDRISALERRLPL